MKRQPGKLQSSTATDYSEKKHHKGVGEVVLGTVVDVDASDVPWVDFPGNSKSVPIPALTTTLVGKENIGRQAALLFAEGNLEKPVIVGLVRNILDQSASSEREVTDEDVSESAEIDNASTKEAVMDGERIVFSAEKEIVLSCGKASITLTRSGKVIIRGEYVLSRSSGANRIKGGSVQIN